MLPIDKSKVLNKQIRIYISSGGYAISPAHDRLSVIAKVIGVTSDGALEILFKSSTRKSYTYRAGNGWINKQSVYIGNLSYEIL